MKTTNLEEMRIAMETYYEEVRAPSSVWVGGRLALWNRRAVRALRLGAAFVQRLQGQSLSVGFSPCTMPELGGRR